LIYNSGCGGPQQQQTNFSSSNISLNTGGGIISHQSPKMVRINYPTNSPKSSTHRHHHHSHVHKYAHHHAHQIRTPNPIVLYSSTNKSNPSATTSDGGGCGPSNYLYNATVNDQTIDAKKPPDQSYPTEYQQQQPPPKLITFKSALPTTTAASHSQLPLLGNCGNCGDMSDGGVKLRGGTLGRNISLSRQHSNDMLRDASSTSYLLKSSLSHGNLHIQDPESFVTTAPPPLHQYGACSNQKFHPCGHNKCPPPTTKKITFISPKEASSGESVNQAAASKSTIL
jgi:hypothetical protein